MFPEGKGVSTIPVAKIFNFMGIYGLRNCICSGRRNKKDPEKNVKRSTILGMLISTVLYILISVVAMGAMSQSELASSTAPISDIIVKVLNLKSLNFLNIAIAISILGTAMGWLLSTARVGYALERMEFSLVYLLRYILSIIRHM